MALENGYNRRDFLKVIGVTTGVAAVGCAKEPIEKIIPYVNQPEEVIPGVAVWYSGTCTECGSGCGVLVRTREGRAVKVEGNPAHPINQGGLCAHGQASLQGLYDPDRIREPLLREPNGSFKAISWPEAVDLVAKKLGGLAAGSEAVILTNPVSGSLVPLLAELVRKVPNARHIEYELLNRNALDRAAELCFGTGIQTHYRFQEAEVLVSVGADFLESWVSPVEFAAGWAKRRKPHPKNGDLSYFVHFEPRYSLTAANADRWLMNRPGGEALLLLGILGMVLEKGGGRGLDGAMRGAVQALTENFDWTKWAIETGVTREELDSLTTKLLAAKSSLIVAGGASATGENTVTNAVLANILNVALGNLGKTLILQVPRKVESSSSYEAMLELVARAKASSPSKIGVMIISGTNPVFTLPEKTGFREAIAKIDFLVSISSQMDETTQLAHLVLPLSSHFESWLDSEPQPGVYNLNQPAMQPLYQSQSLGDTLISILAKLNVTFEGVTSFYDFIRSEWKRRTGDSGFESRWVRYVEQGGDWAAKRASEQQVERPLLASAAKLSIKRLSSEEISANQLMILAFPSVNSFDGSGANKPWLQELPNPITTAVWGSWAEIHPETAAERGVKQGDVVLVRTGHGAIQVPAYLTPRVHRQLVAVPIGQGHSAYGRFATGVGMNPLAMLPPDASGGALQLLAPLTVVEKAAWRETLVTVQGHDYQGERGIIRSVNRSELGKLHHANGHGGHGGAEGSHEANGHHRDPNALGPLPDEKQMYRQMEHPQYRWGMSIDLASCTGCSACVVACNAENNIPVVGRETVRRGREMHWIRIERFFDGPDHRPSPGFLPMLCQHCNNAPCEPVCPVYATYHNDEGLNAMVYNRCVGTRYCSNNCPYKARRFNWFKYDLPEPLTWQLNPDVTVREVGVMEKCTFCVQRIREGRNKAKDLGRPIEDGDIQPACASSCPTKAITFGNLLDHNSKVYQESQSERSYQVFEHYINTQPAVTYLARVVNDDAKPNEVAKGSDHG